MTSVTAHRAEPVRLSDKRRPNKDLEGDGTLRGMVELSMIFTLTGWEICYWGTQMRDRDKLTFVYDANGSVGVVMEFSESDFEAYAMPDLALVGAFQTKAQAAQALGTRTHQITH